MMIPVRCFSCGFPVGAFYKEFKEATAAGKKPGKVMDKLGVKRYCCRRMLVGQVDVIDEVAPFKK
jgi:DNA-directed RNA polymerase subunit N